MKDNPTDKDFERQLDAWAVSRSRAELSPEIQARVKDSLAPSLTPVKPLPSTARLTLVFLAVFAACAVGLIAIMDKAGLHLMTAAQMISIAAILMAGGILFSLTLAWRMIPGSRPRFPVSLALTLSPCGVIGGLALLFPWRTSPAFVSEGWPCAEMEVMIAVPAAVVFWLLARRGALFGDGALGAALSGLAVVFALLVLQFQCMFQEAPHLLIWHGLTATTLIGLGTLIGALQRH